MKHIEYVLSEWMRKSGYKGPTDAARKAGFPRSSFRDWASGHSAPRLEAQRDKLFQLTGSALFQGPLTAELKKLSLAEYNPASSKEACADRLVHLIQAIIPDLRCIVTSGSLIDRELVRSRLTETQLVLFSTLARGLSSEDALKLLQKELQQIEGGGR